MWRTQMSRDPVWRHRYSGLERCSNYCLWLSVMSLGAMMHLIHVLICLGVVGDHLVSFGKTAGLTQALSMSAIKEVAEAARSRYKFIAPQCRAQ